MGGGDGVQVSQKAAKNPSEMLNVWLGAEKTTISLETSSNKCMLKEKLSYFVFMTAHDGLKVLPRGPNLLLRGPKTVPRRLQYSTRLAVSFETSFTNS